MTAGDIYFDNAATTPLDPRVREAMLPFLGAQYGNPSSLHAAGRTARTAVDNAREAVAALLGATPPEIIFTASGTEADNLAVLGVLAQHEVSPQHVVVSAIEHPAVLETCRHAERRGAGVTYLPVAANGIVEPETLAAALRPETRLVSVMAANNVVGTLQPISQLARVAHDHGALFHTDAVQAAGKMPLDVVRLGVDLLSLSAHKLHGPQGVGALYVKRGLTLSPAVFGGGQERGLRSATENVAGLVGCGEAARIARDEMVQEAVRLVALRDRIFAGIAACGKNAYVVGDRFRRLPGHVCVAFAGLEAEAIKLLLALDEQRIFVSSGSACSSHHAGEPSHVLRAMGYDPVQAQGALRITLGRFSTSAEVDHFLDVLPRTLQTLRPATTRVII